MRNELEFCYETYLKEFIEQRVEKLTVAAEKQPQYIKGKASIQHLIEKATTVMESEDVELLVNAIRGVDITIHEYVYYMGIKDGIWLSDKVDKMRK